MGSTMPQQISDQHFAGDRIGRRALSDAFDESGLRYKKKVEGISPEQRAKNEYDEMSLTSRRMMIAGGFLDIALFTTNCEQLKFAIDSKELSNIGRYQFVIVMLAVSLTLQGIMAILFFASGFFSEIKESSRKRRRIINHVILIMVALVTLVNIVITTFSNKAEIAKFCMSMKQIADNIHGDDVPFD
ncbi:uncharacterized protein LOC100906616, partial [Galendromus occidentalis]|uniref:Uncharacterized protein LOC100906616 n=1 Tax=Galendromus occidentalis TaxID=34638 RepID=A0AAJ7PB11_9ACAR